ncbi:MAG TPA: transglycosylase SLT domain-containing protein [Stellaceae bacterium]|jgi:soluble lytic murein transglycosylase-like protein|nr:transglycosylase SLT domain-containing protein [Stellaceae bacterium]
MTVPNNPFPALARAVDPAVVRSIRQASQSTSADFGLLMAQAQRESGFRADAKSSTSSAAGLFQFVDSTWLDMVHRFGDKYGVGDLAQQITQTGSGKLTVSDASIKQKILDLRQDPTISANLAAEYVKQNQSEMEQALGRPLSRGDLYMAHFLGAGGATQFLKALDSKGGTPAAQLLPDAAAANPSIFYDGAGHAKSVRDIYQSVASKIEKDADAFAGDAPMMASASSTAPSKAFTIASVAETLGLKDVASALGAGSATGSGSSAGFSSLGHTVDFSGVKLSAPMIQMLNVVALAALKMTDDNGDARPASHAPAPARPAAARAEHST